MVVDEASGVSVEKAEVCVAVSEGVVLDAATLDEELGVADAEADVEVEVAVADVETEDDVDVDDVFFSSFVLVAASLVFSSSFGSSLTSIAVIPNGAEKLVSPLASSMMLKP